MLQPGHCVAQAHIGTPLSTPHVTSTHLFNMCYLCVAFTSRPTSSGDLVPLGISFDSLAMVVAMQALGMPTPLCNAACEVVVDVHMDSVDGSLLPSALLQAGVTGLAGVRVYGVLVKVRGLFSQSGRHPCAPCAV